MTSSVSVEKSTKPTWWSALDFRAIPVIVSLALFGLGVASLFNSVQAHGAIHVVGTSNTTNHEEVIVSLIVSVALFTASIATRFVLRMK